MAPGADPASPPAHGLPPAQPLRRAWRAGGPRLAFSAAALLLCALLLPWEREPFQAAFGVRDCREIGGAKPKEVFSGPFSR